MDHINSGPYQLLKDNPTTKVKTKTLKQLKVLKDNKFIDNRLYYYLKSIDSSAPRFYGQPKIHKGDPASSTTTEIYMQVHEHTDVFFTCDNISKIFCVFSMLFDEMMN